MRGMPDYPILPLEMVRASGSSSWHVDGHGLVRGIEFNDDVVISYAPHPIPKMEMSRLMVVVEYRALEHDIEFQMRVRYVANGGEVRENFTDPNIPVACKAGERGRWGWELDLTTIQKTDVLSCALVFTPRKYKNPQGEDMPFGPKMLITGAWLHIDD
jgi:hypothetical protein